MSFTEPCEAVGCVFGYHLPGCPYFVVDAFEDVALAVAGEVNTIRPLRESRNDAEADRGQAVADVEAIARTLWAGRWEDLGDWDEGSDEQRAYAHELAERILVALDLPGREQALREEIEELATELAEERTQHEETLRVLGERNTALANVTSALDDLKRANDALHDARDNTARLLEEARAEIAAVLELMDFLEGLDSIVGYNEVRRLLTDRRKHAGGGDHA